MVSLENTNNELRQHHHGKTVNNDNLYPYPTKFILVKNQLEHHYPSELFICTQSTPETYSCKYCGITTHFLMLLNHHIREFHSTSSQPETPFSPEYSLNTYKCRCHFVAYSLLCWLKHTCVCSMHTTNFQPIKKPNRRLAAPGKHKCDECSYSAKRKIQVERHKRKHLIVPDQLNCQHENCVYVAKNRAGLRKHVRNRHTKSEDIKWAHCDKCPYKSKRKSGLNSHYKLKHVAVAEITLFTCDQCSYQARRPDYLKKHKATHLANDEIQWMQCDQCPSKLRTKDSLTIHYKLKHAAAEEAELFTCDQCPYQSRRLGHLKQHKASHLAPEEIKWFQCDQCEHKTRWKHALQYHLRAIHGAPVLPTAVKSFKCEHCDFTAKQRGHLKVHLLAKHTPDEAVTDWYQCELCPYKAKYKVLLNSHMVLNHKEGVKRIEIVQRPHNGENRTYLKLREPSDKPETRKDFVNVHSDESDGKWFECDQCEYKSKRKINLKEHVQVSHTALEDVEWVQCEDCDFKAKTRKNLGYHRRTKHRAVKWVTCDRCPYQTKFTTKLKKHVINKHTDLGDIQWHRCAHCDFKSKMKYGLKMHLIRRH